MKINKDKVRLAMAKACMSMPDVAKKAEMPYSTTVQAMRGRCTSPCTAGRIAKALNVDVEEILEKEG